MKRLALVAFSLFVLLPAAVAQPRSHARAELFHRQDGETIRALIRIRIDGGYHLYHDDLGHPDAIGKPTKITMHGTDVTWSAPRFPDPERFDQSAIAGNGAFIQGHEGTIWVSVTGRVEDGSQVEDVRVDLNGLTCEDDGSCVPYVQKGVASRGAGDDALFASLSSERTAEKVEWPPATQDGRARATVYAQATQDGALAIAIELAINDGFHLYHDDLGHPDAIGQPTKISFKGGGLQVGPALFPEPERYDQSDITPGAFIYGHEGTLLVYAAGQLEEGASASDLRVDITGLTCEDNGSCVPFTAKNLAVSASTPKKVFSGFPATLRELVPDEPPATDVQPPGAPSQKGEARATIYHRVTGREVRVAIQFEIDSKYHLYHDDLGHPDAIGQPTRITLHGDGIEWSAPRFPEPNRYDQSDIEPGLFILGHEGTIVVYARGTLEEGASGKTVWADIDGLTCEDDGSCVPYEGRNLVSAGAGAETLFASFPEDFGVAGETAEGGRKTTAIEKPMPARDWTEAQLDAIEFPDYTARDDGLADRSLLMWMVFAFIAGIILNVMPCVLPVISLKVLSLVSQAGESRGRMLMHGAVYSAGILSVFLILASLAAFANQGWGEQFQSQTFLVIMIGFVFAFSLSLLGVFELGVPTAVGAMAGTQREGLKDAFVKGIMTTLLATPCSGPFLGATLAWAVSQDQVTIFAVFIMVGLGMAAPYLLLVSHPAFLKFVPKPGAWMETFKQAMGFVLLATVVFLMISLNQDLMLFTVAFLIFVGLGSWVWGRFARFEHSRARHLGTLAIALLIVAGGGHVSYRWLPGLLGQGEASAQAGERRVQWEPFDPERLAAYHLQGRSVLIDFTADWCLTCKTNEAFVYHTEEVEEVLQRKNVACMIADLTTDTPLAIKAKDLMQQLGSHSIPFLAIFPNNDSLHPHTLRDLVTKSEVLEILESLPDPKVAKR